MTMNRHRKVNVLLVDDQPAKLLSYEVMLGELGENLIKTSSAKEALEVLLKNDIAVILVDVCMPELDGFELARMIRNHPRFQRTAIIFISAIHISEADSLKGYDAGAVDYVPVPVVPEVLRAKVKIFAELYRKTHQLEELNRELESRVAERTSELEAAASRLLESEQSRSIALAAGNMGSWEHNFEDNSWVLDAGQYRIFDIDPAIKGPPPGFVKSLFHAEDWDRLLEALNRATTSEPTIQTELRVIRRSGEVRSCLVAAAVTFNAAGKPRCVNGVTIDITERKETERRQMLLTREVDHRARNALAIVQAIVRLGRADTLDGYVKGVEGRIRALALSHELLSQSRWQGADIARLVEEEFAPYRTGDNPRVRGLGPAVILSPDKAQSVALLLHELATNAAKYGALSVPSGQVDLRWQLQDGQIILIWSESGGPSVAQPKTKGFGMRIIESSLDSHRGDGAQFEWAAGGLRCTIKLTLTAPNKEVELSAPPVAIGADCAPSRQRQVLLVEDEILVGMLTSEMLNQMGHAVVGPCANLTEAMDVFRSSHIDGAVLDVNLGGQPIFPLARILADRAIPMVFLTGYEKTVVEKGFERFPVLRKPVAAEELEKALTSVLERVPENIAVG
jgi:two-component sensor histidine kinase/DNA-binding response OmpR family regulator